MEPRLSGRDVLLSVRAQCFIICTKKCIFLCFLIITRKSITCLLIGQCYIRRIISDTTLACTIFCKMMKINMQNKKERLPFQSTGCKNFLFITGSKASAVGVGSTILFYNEQIRSNVLKKLSLEQIVSNLPFLQKFLVPPFQVKCQKISFRTGTM